MFKFFPFKLVSRLLILVAMLACLYFVARPKLAFAQAGCRGYQTCVGGCVSGERACAKACGSNNASCVADCIDEEARCEAVCLSRCN